MAFRRRLPFADA